MRQKTGFGQMGHKYAVVVVLENSWPFRGITF